MKKWIIIISAALLVVVLTVSSVYVVREDQYAAVSRFSKIIHVEENPGLHFRVPFIDAVKYFSKAAQLYDIPPSEVYTSDQQNMNVDCYVLWKIADPITFYQRLETDAEAEGRLDTMTYTALKNALGSLTQADIINMEDGAKRNEIYEGIAESVAKQAKDIGIDVLDVKIKRFDLPESNLNAVYTRMISQRNQMSEKFTADGNLEASIIRNEVDKQVNITISNAEAQAAQLTAEGEAEYMRLLAEAYNTKDKKEFYEFMLALDALKASLTGNEKTVVLDQNSQLAQILMGQ
jgi:membrane protease subunit HflC